MIKFEMLDDGDEWNRVVRASPYGTVFHTFEWMDVLEQQYKVQKIPLGIFENGDLIGVFPAFLQRKGIFNILVSPLHEAATPYAGPVVGNNKLSDVIRAFDIYSECADYYDITFSPGYVYDDNVLENLDFQERYTYILNLDQSIDIIWKNLNKKCRNAIRKAKKSDVTIVEGNSQRDLEDFWEMIEVTFQKWDTESPISVDYTRAVYDAFSQNEQFKMIFAERDGERIGGAIFLCFADKIYYWQGASYPDYYRYAPNNLIQWHIIQWAVQNGFRIYDMLGANIPSIAKFKSSFGGDLVSYSYLYKSHSSLADAGRGAYVWWRKNVKRDLYR
ncbi:lipid II:glycine glycyltransferase (peptidoglycan interpeptide bridge formation enzyme) [Methanofollis sp. W23]|uniref:lipid II:glycine glycyltransferase FemX n=1 Tax=Methanofollis sp. W23 TaxID=2817849 RepID=UPI001AE109BC|nr:GNAT family N-acetyltransferase [Methanofollis sp. W23]MBP2144642.1 lipid II:glycine glycyltransferase (peptidoglycan interpeptide bridge formation enzyme) [Methanofollis sp. W23]